MSIIQTVRDIFSSHPPSVEFEEAWKKAAAKADERFREYGRVPTPGREIELYDSDMSQHGTSDEFKAAAMTFVCREFEKLGYKARFSMMYGRNVYGGRYEAGNTMFVSIPFSQ